MGDNKKDKNMEGVRIGYSGTGYKPVAALVNMIINLRLSEEFKDRISVYQLPKHVSAPRNWHDFSEK
jgi:hypothetical protein